MVAYHRSSALHAYVLAVSAVGLALVVLLAVEQGPTAMLRQPSLFWVLLASLVVIESLPILTRISGGTQALTTAEAFAFAILLGWGTTAAVYALGLAVLVSEVLRRAAPEKIVFNVGQSALLMGLAGGVYEILGGDRPFTVRHLPAFATAALVYFLGNLVLVGLVTTLAHGRSFRADVKECLRAEAWPYTMVFAMAPIMLAVAEQSMALLPLVLLPLFAVRDALRTAEEPRSAVWRPNGRPGRPRPWPTSRRGWPRSSTPWSSGCRRATDSRTTCWPPCPTSCGPRWPGCWGRWPP